VSQRHIATSKRTPITSSRFSIHHQPEWLMNQRVFQWWVLERSSQISAHVLTCPIQLPLYNEPLKQISTQERSDPPAYSPPNPSIPPYSHYTGYKPPLNQKLPLTPNDAYMRELRERRDYRQKVCIGTAIAFTLLVILPLAIYGGFAASVTRKNNDCIQRTWAGYANSC